MERHWPTSVNPVRKLIIEFIAGNEGERKALAGRALSRVGFPIDRSAGMTFVESEDPYRLDREIARELAPRRIAGDDPSSPINDASEKVFSESIYSAASSGH